MQDILELDFTAAPTLPPTGRPERFGGRWRLTGAGAFDVWRYGELDLPAPSGRLLMRGPNGTGKTTALEALWPYLLDLSAAKLGAGKARQTTLKQLMSEGAPQRGRRYGYLWLTFAAPDTERGADELAVSFGVRLQYSPSSTPAVKPVPFTVPGRPLHELRLRGDSGAALEYEEFRARVDAAGGRVFDSAEDYVEHLAATVFSGTAADVYELAERLRQIRNPSLLGDVSPAAAADALRQSLPGVSPDVLAATADALAESDTTRQAFEADARAAKVLDEFARTWAGHVVDVVREAHARALDAATELGQRQLQVTALETAVAEADRAAQAAEQSVRELDEEERAATNEARAIELSAAYQAHGRVTDLRQRLEGERAGARGQLAALQAAAQQAARATQLGTAALEAAIGDLTELVDKAREAGAAPTAVETLLDHHARARLTRRVGDAVADPGPGLTVSHEPEKLTELEHAWTALAEAARAEADRAQLAVKAHEAVSTVEAAATAAERAAARADTEHDEAIQHLQRATVAARDAARDLLTAVDTWAQTHPHLRGVTVGPSTAATDGDRSAQLASEHRGAGEEMPTDQASVWDEEDPAELATAEPAQVVAAVSGWASHTLATGEALAAAQDAAAAQDDATARELHSGAERLRAAAAELRAGKLVPLPRPQWAGSGDDDAALGAILEWRVPDGDDEAKALLELALADAGVLGATVTDAHVHTSVWTITAAIQPELAGSTLADVLTVNPDSAHASTAAAVLTRIALTDTATAGHALCIGRDGTYSTGPVLADPPRAMTGAGQPIPAASHIGARTRLKRAQQRAAEYEAQADELDQQANAARQRADDARAAAKNVRAQARSFPDQRRLVDAEARRATSAESANTRRQAAEAAHAQADQSAERHRRALTEWTEQTRTLSLPADLELLATIINTGRERHRTLTGCVRDLAGRVSRGIRRALESLPDEGELAHSLAGVEQAALSAHHLAQATAQLLAEAESAGDTDAAVARYGDATRRAETLRNQIGPAREAAAETSGQLAGRQADLRNAQERLEEVRPQQLDTEAHLRSLVTWPAVSAALELDERSADAGTLPHGDALLETIDQLLGRRRTATRKVLFDRYDQARAELAQTWAIAHAEPPADHPELATFVLTHAETEYDPPRAARRAATLADRARAALDAAEAAALREFVIGRLPSAIGTAWAALMDWKAAVNAKMRAAQASSGVGVQVQVGLREDLDPTARTLWELSCTVGDAVRTEQQKQRVGAAISSLLAAADGNTMADRLTAAIDIRDWADVHYLVERPGPGGVRTQRRWGSRTALSGGERRLVVLAPMLAAIAANYDRLSPTGARLVPLDEVPAEVDERGREGLARYLAELDLDVICTSYLWDGAPGAWDGIDAHDLEAGADGTVVAFPMIIRGLGMLPGDDPSHGDALTDALSPDPGSDP